MERSSNQVQHISFTATDGVVLPGLLYQPATPTHKVTLWLHGMGDSGVFYSPKRITALAASLTARGISLLAFNNRGAHNSKTLYRADPELPKAEQRVQAGTHYELIADCVKDINGAVNYLKTMNFRQFYLAGHSTGANKICVYNALTAKTPFRKYVLAGPGDDVGLHYQSLGDKQFWRSLALANKAINQDKPLKVMPKHSGMHPFSAQSAADILNPNGLYNTFPYHEALHGGLGKKALFKEFTAIAVPVMVVAGSDDEATSSAGGAAAALEMLAEHCNPTIRDHSSFEIVPDTDHSFHGAETDFAERVATWLVQ